MPLRFPTLSCSRKIWMRPLNESKQKVRQSVRHIRLHFEQFASCLIAQGGQYPSIECMGQIDRNMFWREMLKKKKKLVALLCFIALSAAQSFAQTHIHSAILVIDTSNNASYIQVHWLVGTPYLSIKASNEHGRRWNFHLHTLAACLAQFRMVADKTVDLYSDCPSLFNYTDSTLVPSVDKCKELSCDAGANVFNWSVLLPLFYELIYSSTSFLVKIADVICSILFSNTI